MRSGAPRLLVPLHPEGPRGGAGSKRTVRRPAGLPPQWTVGARRPLAAARLWFAPLEPEWPSRVLGDEASLSRFPGRLDGLRCSRCSGLGGVSTAEPLVRALRPHGPTQPCRNCGVERMNRPLAFSLIVARRVTKPCEKPREQ